MEQEFTQFNETYNSLSTVEQANERLLSLDKNIVLNILSEVILKYGLQETVGIRLLHNHNSIGKDELMLEAEEKDASGKSCLVTIAKAAKDVIDHYPNSWKLQNGEYHPLEYSNDKFVTSTGEIINRQQAFFAEFRANIELLDVNEILGPCIIGRDFYRKCQSLDPFILAEITDDTRRANIVKYEGVDKYDEQALIYTTWVATRNEPSSNPETGCVAACIAISACVVDDAGNHNRVTRHNVGTHIHSDDSK